jgi:hypothetical protein
MQMPSMLLTPSHKQMPRDVDIHTNTWSIPELRGTISPTINETMSEFTDRQNIEDLRKLRYDDGCSEFIKQSDNDKNSNQEARVEYHSWRLLSQAD